jgi:hypothetical protein
LRSSRLAQGAFSSAYLPAWDLLKSLQTGPRDQPAAALGCCARLKAVWMTW